MNKRWDQKSRQINPIFFNLDHVTIPPAMPDMYSSSRQGPSFFSGLNQEAIKQVEQKLSRSALAR